MNLFYQMASNTSLKDKPSQSNFPFGGVHGLGVLLRKEIFNFVSIIKQTKSETVFWLKISEKAFGFPFIPGAVYIPPENSKYFNDSYV